MGYRESGYSMIDPDGEGGVEPFLVYCDMESDPTTGISVVEHYHVVSSILKYLRYKVGVLLKINRQ